MLGDVPLWTTVLQFLAAGLVGGFCVLQWVGWRGSLRAEGRLWPLALSSAVAVQLLVAGVHGLVAGDLAPEILTGVHAQVSGVVALLLIPTTRALGGGPSPRPWVVAAGTVLAVRSVLWWVDLRLGTQVVVGRPVAVALLLVVVAVVLAYVVAALGRTRLQGIGWLVATLGGVSLALLTWSVVHTGTQDAHVIAALWPLPFVLALETVALVRLRRSQRTARRRGVMRDALADVTNTAWFRQDADQLLEHARDAARTVLGDPSVEGSLRPLQNGRFVAELYVDDATHLLPFERAFLVDLAQVVSTAAERYVLADRLARAAVTDPLTHLPNRRAVDDHLKESLEQAGVERTRVALLYVDVDGFKAVNDRLGHAGGDELLRRVADWLRTSQADPDTFVGRLAGDEFAVVVCRAPGDEELAARAAALCAGFAEHVGGAGGPRLTCGVAAWEPTAVAAPDVLLRDADAAMLEAKRTRSGHRVYDRELRERTEQQRRRRAALERAVAEDRITAYYQPIVDARTLEVLSLEALARWEEDGDLVLPGEWIDIAEESGLIVPIGRHMLRLARRALDRHQMPLAVNLSARELHEPDVLDRIDEAWSGGPWEHLTLEITESVMLRTSAAVPVLSELRARGAHIALDDFGTGYSSLARLARLPVDILKIDRSFVREVRTPRGAGAVRAIVSLAGHHGLEVVAEGVESAADLEALVDLGVPRVQGNFVGRPAPGIPVRGARPVPRPVARPRPLRRRTGTGDVVPRPLRVVADDTVAPELL
ncbi:putative bifunctional diguanylate cyclase/phosphodiesterase [Cellulomonas oligotrophica]|uniref:Diguanylate cyclase (GGDEF)-like protein n=1 Tax=Cellulomonas oligotrophica TaxID=931536 RepID=A0A7Y9FCP3_9CELL|nr:bifunctional diguanylate cyclase/phosphodiesterase [Cellulomonas oligotrophica]NYD84704.1 diguanylate cyclase (GGDEF)-like protein [Cellulomonas oligotrophica]GIG31771.1 hypothetical protein Col01nite_09300 [Cellulomonas oligotrophica]